MRARPGASPGSTISPRTSASRSAPCARRPASPPPRCWCSAIGIGATVAAFSSFNMALLRPLPIPSPQEILRFQRQGPDQYWTDVPYPAVAFYREHARTLSVFSSTTAHLSAEGEEKPAMAFFVTGNFLTELGATPLLGRVFNVGDEAPGSPPMVVLHHRFWTGRFGADPGIVGKDIRLNGKTAVVVGVVTPGFSGLGGDAPELWALVQQHPYFVQGSPLLTDFSGQRNPGTTNMWGRLRAGVTAPAAEGELMALAAELRRTHPDDVWEGERLRAEPGGYLQSIGSRSRGTGPAPRLQARLYPMFAIVVVLVLLILAVACGNLGSLLLARGAARQREIGLRVALGAGRLRLVRQLLTESLVLALLGSLAGLALGVVVMKAVLVWTDAPPWIDPTPDWRVVTFALGIGGMSALLFGLSPALYVARQRTGRSRGRSVMIAGQVAASCVLLIVAGLLVRAFDRASSQDPGFDYRHTVLIEPWLLQHGYQPARARVWLDGAGAAPAGIARRRVGRPRDHASAGRRSRDGGAARSRADARGGRPPRRSRVPRDHEDSAAARARPAHGGARRGRGQRVARAATLAGRGPARKDVRAGRRDGDDRRRRRGQRALAGAPGSRRGRALSGDDRERPRRRLGAGADPRGTGDGRRGDRGGGPGDRSRPAAEGVAAEEPVPRPDPRRGARRGRGRPARYDRAARRLPGRRRPRRVRGRAADEGDRHPPGARRGPARHPAQPGGPVPADGGSRSRRRHRRRGRTVAGAAAPALRRERARSGQLCRRRVPLRAGRRARGTPARAARPARRSRRSRCAATDGRQPKIAASSAGGVTSSWS